MKEQERSSPTKFLNCTLLIWRKKDVRKLWWTCIGVAWGEAGRNNKSLCLEGYELFFHRHKGKTKHKLPTNCQRQLSRGYLLLTRLASSKNGKIYVWISPRSFIFLLDPLAAKVK
jgi:hypothetical protein